jgi:hypothetical protein
MDINANLDSTNKPSGKTFVAGKGKQVAAAAARREVAEKKKASAKKKK